MTELQEKILEEIKKGNNIQKDIAEKLETTTATISRNINMLFERNIVTKKNGKLVILPVEDQLFYVESSDISRTCRIKEKSLKEVERLGFKNINDFIIHAINIIKKTNK